GLGIQRRMMLARDESVFSRLQWVWINNLVWAWSSQEKGNQISAASWNLEGFSSVSPPSQLKKRQSAVFWVSGCFPLTNIFYCKSIHHFRLRQAHPYNKGVFTQKAVHRSRGRWRSTKRYSTGRAFHRLSRTLHVYRAFLQPHRTPAGPGAAVAGDAASAPAPACRTDPDPEPGHGHLAQAADCPCPQSHAGSGGPLRLPAGAFQQSPPGPAPSGCGGKPPARARHR